MIELAVDNSNVVKLDTINLADVAGTLRSIADDIDKGEVGAVERVIVILVGDDGEPLTLGCGAGCNQIITLGTLSRAAYLFNQSLEEYDDG